MKIASFKSESELLDYAKQLEGMRIADISAMVGRLDHEHRRLTKSVIANIIETDYFGIPTNSDEAPDFKELGIELKVSPLKPIYNGTMLVAKERNVIGMVDYEDVLKNAVWKKNRRLAHKLGKVLFVFYVHDDAKLAGEWRVACVFLWSPTSEQDARIQRDYDIIRGKIQMGMPNREGDNEFLATCPKHEGGFDREEPASSNPNSLCDHPTMGMAERRGFCIRNKPVVEIIAGSLGLRLKKKGASLGIPVGEFKVLGSPDR